MNFLAVVTTIGSRAEAQQLARTMVEQGLAACAQISEIESFFNWQGAVCNEIEFRVTFKTRASAYPAIEKAIHVHHSYELPAIHAYPIQQISGRYADWIISETGSDEST